MLGISQEELAELSGVSRVPLANFEAGKSKPYARTLHAIKDALESAGVHFVDPNGLGAGVRLKDT